MPSWLPLLNGKRQKLSSMNRQITFIFLISLVSLAQYTFATTEADNQWLPDSVKSMILRRYYVQALPELNRLAYMDQNSEAAFWLGQFYQCGKIVDFDCAQAAQLYHKVLLNSTSDTLKDRAQAELTWLNATCQQGSFKNDYQSALLWAQKGNMKSPYRLDTLAAAQAANGQYKEAIQSQQKAISALDELALHATVPMATLVAFKGRLDHYQKKQPAALNRQNALANCTAFPP